MRNLNSGVFPFDIKLENILQVSSIPSHGNRYNNESAFAFLSDVGQVVIVSDNKTFVIDMGDEVTDTYVMEFTVRVDGDNPNREQIYLLKNLNGVVVEYSHRYMGKPKYKGIKATNVIKVLNGEMLIHDNGDANNLGSYVLDGNGGYIPADANGNIDIISDGYGGVIWVKPTDADANVLKRVGEYTITKDHKLLKGTTEIASDIIDMIDVSLASGSAFVNCCTELRNLLLPSREDFYRTKVEQSWYDAFLTYFDSVTPLESCVSLWSGSGTEEMMEQMERNNQAIMQRARECIPNVSCLSSIYLSLAFGTTGQAPASFSGMLFTNVGGELLSIQDGELVKQHEEYADDKAFNILHGGGQEGKAFSFKKLNGSEEAKGFYFEESETGFKSSYLFRG